jgi:aconitate hydratase
MLALTFVDKSDYDKIQEDDRLDIEGLLAMAPGKNLQLVLNHNDGSNETIQVQHSYNAQQIEWFKAGGALNIIRAGIQ